jgi:hypothetical protein
VQKEMKNIIGFETRFLDFMQVEAYLLVLNQTCKATDSSDEIGENGRLM